MIRWLVLASVALSLVGCGSAKQEPGTNPPSIKQVQKNKLAAIKSTQMAAEAQGPRNVQGRRSACADGSAPTWSPDGKQLAWAGRTALCLADTDGSQVRALTQTEGGLVDAPFRLVWVRPELLLYDDDYVISGLQPAGKVLFSGVEAPSFTVSGDGTRFATGTTSDCPDCVGPGNVWTLSGSHVGTIGDAKHYYDAPSLSPDGSKVTFAQGGIWVANADGSGAQKLVSAGLDPVWSPSGDEIAYITTDAANPAGSLWVVGANGGSSRLLGRDLTANGGWSPNGKLIASWSIGRVTIVDVATGKTRNLPFVGYPDYRAPAWSPDSKQLLMTARLSARCYSLWREPVDGSKPVLLSSCY